MVPWSPHSLGQQQRLQQTPMPHCRCGHLLLHPLCTLLLLLPLLARNQHHPLLQQQPHLLPPLQLQEQLPSSLQNH
jgi:hypothetical protein